VSSATRQCFLTLFLMTPILSLGSGVSDTTITSGMYSSQPSIENWFHIRIGRKLGRGLDAMTLFGVDMLSTLQLRVISAPQLNPKLLEVAVSSEATIFALAPMMFTLMSSRTFVTSTLHLSPHS